MHFYSSLLLQLSCLRKDPARHQHPPSTLSPHQLRPLSLSKHTSSTFAYTLVLSEQVLARVKRPEREVCWMLGVGRI
jgi:hypothetical protein